MKKFLYVLLAAVAFVVLVLLVVPFFVSVDQFRPQVVAAAESHMKAKVDVGPLNLRLFPKFKISSESLTITPLKESGFDKSLLQSMSLSMESSLLSLLSSPKLTIKIDTPSVNIVKRNQKTNLESMLLATAEVPAEQATPTIDANAGAGSPRAALSGLPPWVRSRVEAASFSLIISEAHLVYEDLDALSKIEMSKVDFSLNNIGLNQNMKARFAANLDFKGDGLLAKGPLKAEIDIVSKTGSNQEILLEMKGSKDLSGLELKMTDLFVKKASIPFGASFAGNVVISKSISVDFGALSMEFGTMAIKGSLKGQNMASPDTAVVDFLLHSNSLNLADLASYVPMVSAYKLSGKAEFSANLKGSMGNPNLDVSLIGTEIQGSSPELATPIRNLQAQVLVSGALKSPVVEIKKVQMQIGKNSDLVMNGVVRGIDAMDVNLNVESKNIDMDEIMGTPNDGKVASKAVKGAPKAEEAVSTLPLDDSLSQMAPTIAESLKNPMLDNMTAKFQTKLAKVKFMGAEYLDAALVVNVKNRDLTISKTSIQAYKGVIALSGSMKLVPNQTEFRFNTNLSSISIGDVVKAHAPDWVGALSGSAIGSFEISGKGFTKDELKQNLRGSILGDVKDGKTNLAVVQVVNQVLESIPKNLSSAISSKAKDSSKNQFIAGDFETMKINAQIVGRKINLKSMDTVFKSSDDRVGKFRFNADGSVTFDQDVDMVGVAYLSPDLIRVPQLKGKSGLVEVPLKFGGKMYEPKVDVEYSLKRIGDNALKNVAKDEAKKAIEKFLPELQKKGPKDLKKSLKDLKKFFK